MLNRHDAPAIAEEGSMTDALTPSPPAPTPLTLAPPAEPARDPVVSVAARSYLPVGDFAFSANRQIDDAPVGPAAGDPMKLAMWIENQAERTIRELLERRGLRLKRYWTWVQVMNRVRKSGYQLFEYPDPEQGGWHLFHHGVLVAKVSYPFWEADGHLKIVVS
jgi:hypothetical protein